MLAEGSVNTQGHRPATPSPVSRTRETGRKASASITGLLGQVRASVQEVLLAVRGTSNGALVGSAVLAAALAHTGTVESLAVTDAVVPEIKGPPIGRASSL